MKLSELGLLTLSFLLASSAFGAETYSGYIVYDEEMIGFYPCGGGSPYGLAQSKVDIQNLYRSYKEYLREPLFFELQADLVDSGAFVFGPASEPVENNIQVVKVNKYKGIPR